MKRYGLIGLGLLLSLGLIKWKVMAVVGLHVITRSEVAARDTINQFLNPAEKRSLGLQQLLEAQIRRRILERFDIQIKKQDLISDAQRIDNQTLDPSKLAQIKVLVPDQELYLQAFVLPALVNQKIFSIANFGNEKIHQESFLQADRFRQKISANSDFEKILESEKGIFRKLKISTTRGLMLMRPKENLPLPQPSQWDPSAKPLADRLLRDFLKTMQAGQMIPQVLDRQDMWWILRLDKITQEKKSETVYELSVGIFMKADPEAWLQKQSAEIWHLVL